MKTKLILTVLALGIGAYASIACSVSSCGGGNDKCCSVNGATYYMTKKAPQQ